MSSLFKALGAVLCLVFALCFAAPNAGAQKSSDLPSVHGSGTVNVIPLWNSSSTLGNSVLSQSGGNLSTSGNFSATGAGTFGSISTSGNFSVTGAGTFGSVSTTPFGVGTFGTVNLNADINLDITRSASVGVINAGGFPFIHNFGGSTFIGLNAGNFSTTGSFDIGIGAGTLQNDNGGNNTAVGTIALQANTTGFGNTAIGSFAGVTSTPLNANANITGSNNTFIGANAGPGTGTPLTGSTAIGFNARVSASGAMVLGDPLTKVGIGTQSPTTRLQVAGGNISQTDAGGGLIVKSPDGTKCALIGIDNGGLIAVTPANCP
jgi:trimeric autotransporter adhesin